MQFRELITRRQEKKFSFLGQSIIIQKLSVAEVEDLQMRSKEVADDEKKSLAVMLDIIRKAVPEARDTTDEDFQNASLADLNDLVKAILEFSGLGGGK